VTAYRMHRGLTLDEMLRFCAWINASDGAYSVEAVVHQGWTALCRSIVGGEEDADLSTPYAWAVAVIDQRRGVSARFVDPRQVAAFQHDGTYRRCPRYEPDPRPYEPDPRPYEPDPRPYEPDPEGIQYEFHWAEVWPLLRLRPRWPRGTALVDVVDGGRDDFYADVIAPTGLPPRRYCASCVCPGLDDQAYQVYICTAAASVRAVLAYAAAHLR